MKNTRFSAFLTAQAARVRVGFLRFSAVAACTLTAYILFLITLFADGTSARLAWLQSGLTGCLWAVAAALVLQLARERCAALSACRWLPWAGGIAAGVMATLLWHGDRSGDSVYWCMVYFGLLAAAVFLACWLLSGPENEAGLFAHLVKSAVFCGAVALVVMLGLWICLLAADVLLLDVDWEVYEAVLFLPWILLAPNLFCACLPGCGEAAETPKAYRVIAAGAALPVYLLLLAVLYGYILKILIAWNMPSGRMNWYASFALAAYLFFWLGLRMVQNRPVQLFVRWGWVLLVPIVAVQLVGIAIRLAAYGLTFLRMLGLVCLGLGIFGLALAALKKGPRALYLAGAVTAVVFTMTPLNVCDLACMEQTARLKSALVQYGMWDGTEIRPAASEPPAEAQAVIRSSWDYLRYHEPALYHSALQEQAAAIPSRDFAERFGFVYSGGTGYETAEYERIGLEASDDLDISGYSHLYGLGSYRDIAVEQDGSCVLRCQWEDGTELEADLSEYIAGLLARYPEDGTLAPADAWLPLPDGRALYVTGVFCSARDGVPEYAWCSGYLLVP